MNEEQFRSRIYWVTFLFSMLVVWVHSYNGELFLGLTGQAAVVDRIERAVGEQLGQMAVPGFFMVSAYLFYRRFTWEKLLYNLDYEGENFMNLLFDMSLKKDAIGNCLSTSVRTNGAVAVFLPGVAQRLGKLIGGSFYMVFTSIHEVMIHSEDSADPRKLKEVLAETVEETTPEEDFLTYYVYHYNAETGQFSYY